jgi:hypothetical protein
MEDSNNITPLSEPIASTPKPLSPFQRFMGVFTSPLATLQEIAARPDWMVPLIILAVSALIFTYLMLPAIQSDAAKNIEKMVDAGKLTAEQGERAQAASQGFTKMFAPLMGALGEAAVGLIAAAILLFVGNIVMSGRAVYQQMFSVFLWTGMVNLIGGVLRIPLALKQNTMMVFFSPAAFMNPEAQETALFRAASFLDIFVVWRMILVAIGFSAIYKFSIGKSLGVILGLFVLLIVVSVTFMGLF